MGKFKMPTVHELYKRKFINDKFKEDVWVYLDREMKAGIHKKPYNKKVGKWLTFLRDLKAHYRHEANRKYRRLNREVGPRWYIEFCTSQREILDGLKLDIYQDLIEDLPLRVSKSLRKLGVTINFKPEMLMTAMENAVGDPGLFMWFLYQAYYKTSPSIKQHKYSLDQMLMMSCLVFIDFDDCVEALEELTRKDKDHKVKPARKIMKYFEPDVKYGMYLQKMFVNYVPSPSLNRPKPRPPDGIKYKIKVRSAESLERLCRNENFLTKRLNRNAQKQREEVRVCNYKFWEPPITLRAADPKMAAYVEKLKMVRLKAKPNSKLKSQIRNVHCQLGTVSYTGGVPRFVINNFTSLPTGYIPVIGGVARIHNEYITLTSGMWKFPRDAQEKCDNDCKCLTWEKTVVEYLNETKCKCYHNYDYYNEGNKMKERDKFFLKSTKHSKYWFDKPKIYQLDPLEDFVRGNVEDALNSETLTDSRSASLMSISGMKLRELLQAFLADLSNSHLVIPHLPDACLLTNLQAWIRRKLHGNKPTPEMHKKMSLQSQRRWVDLSHIDFRARAYLIPFTQKEMTNITYKHYYYIQELTSILMHSFINRNKKKIVQQSRLWWPTMKNDIYPSKAFTDVFFTYMPVKKNDIFLLNPYSFHFVRMAGRGCGRMH